MTLTKTVLTRKVQEQVRFRNRKRGPQLFLFPEMDCVFMSPKRAAEIVDHLFEIMKRTLVGGEDIFIRQFGKFKVQFRWARPGRNPRTGESMIIGPRRQVSFKTSPSLKERLNPKRGGNLAGLSPELGTECWKKRTAE